MPTTLTSQINSPALRKTLRRTSRIKSWNAVVVLPTYNERQNIIKLLQEILIQGQHLRGVKLGVLVVDDSSPDGTAQAVEKFAATHPAVHLLGGFRKSGLGVAYTNGFEYAMEQLKADIVFEMDADFSHDPELIPDFINQILLGKDFVIGSRYIPGGSVPSDWPAFRRWNSRVANWLARTVAGISGVHDCTSGYRAIRVDFLRRINLRALGSRGYSFQMNLLHEAVRLGAKVAEIPLQFVDRKRGQSKMRLTDITEFTKNAFKLGLKAVLPMLVLFGIGSVVLFVAVIGAALIYLNTITLQAFLIGVTVIMSSLMLLQGIFTLIWMLYAWENPDSVFTHKSPQKFAPAKHSFTAIIPARHEERVIFDTIQAVANIDYPESKKQILVAIREDDAETIEQAQDAIRYLSHANIQLVTFDGYPINKPHSLNEALQHATKDVVVVFDAEDQPHRDLYRVVNTVMVRDQADVVQSGVQLMNFRAPWFSTLNILEYFFWFKSALHFFASNGTIPLGGNSVFFKREWLARAGGWDEECLTEDAEIGIRLTAMGAKTSIVYDERHATQEETPPSLPDFIRQRTRWNQGFLQVFLKGDWLNYPKLTQKLLAFHILVWPFIQAGMVLYLPVPLILAIWFKLPVPVAMFANLPLYTFFLQVIALEVGLYEFFRGYGIKYSFASALRIIWSIVPFHFILGISSIRAVGRTMAESNNWEKTSHVNAHRQAELVTAREEIQL